MIQRIDHISIAVRDFEKARAFFQDIFGAVPGATATDDSMKYQWRIFSLGDMSRLELISPTGAGSFLDNFLKDRDGGAHHMTLQTPDIGKARKTLETRGIPYFGYREYGEIWKELFIHPRDAFGLLIQIAEFNADDWLPDSVKMKGNKKWAIDRTPDGVTIKISHPGGGSVSLDLTQEEAGTMARELLDMLRSTG